VGFFTSIRNLVTAPLKIVAAPVAAIVGGSSIAGGIQTQVNTAVTSGQVVARNPIVQAVAATAATVATGGALAAALGGGALATGVGAGIAGGAVSKLQGNGWSNSAVLNAGLTAGFGTGGQVGNIIGQPVGNIIGTGLQLVEAVKALETAKQNYNLLAELNTNAAASAPVSPVKNSITPVAAGYVPVAKNIPVNTARSESYAVPIGICLAALLFFALPK
jgi:hypothetical protein